MSDGSSEIDIKTYCRWNSEIQDITGCGNTSFEICMIVKNDSRLKQCINGRPFIEQFFCIGLIKNNSDYCKHITDIKQQIRCIAYIKNKPELCEETGNLRDWCYQDYAINKHNLLLCDKINDSSKKMSCLGVAKLDPKICNSLNERDKFICIINIAEYTKNKKLCEMLSLNYKEKCYNELNSFIK
jgi:hypothetical protein